MRNIRQPSLICGLACILPLTLLAACATPTQPDVGAVVVAPKPRLQPVPEVVKKTPPKTAGYFQRSLVDYFNASHMRPTPSTSPTPVAERTPTQ